MEILLSAAIGELASRSVGVIVDKFSKTPALAVEDTLQRILLRAQVIVDEAAERRITNRGMLQQLAILRGAIYRGHHVLDTFRNQSHEEEDAGEDQALVSHSSTTLSKLQYARSLFLSGSSKQTSEELQEALQSLNTMVADVSELVVFLQNYPRLCRQPYSMHLLLGNCMFGRQMEMDVVIDFLLCRQPHGGHEFDVLPIIGPGKVGKSTLVAHVCSDDRVRDHFSHVVFLNNNDFSDEMLGLKNCSSKEDGRLLVVVELVGDLNENAWKMLCSASKRCKIRGMKVIITSRSRKVIKFGTMQALTLKRLPHEAYWYFFKVITFGSTNPEMHPKLAYLAMEVAKLLKNCLIAANVIAFLLSKTFDIHYWSKVLAFLRLYIQEHISKVGEHPSYPFGENKLSFMGRMGGTIEDLSVFQQYETCSSQVDIPKISILDVMYGSVKPVGKFEALVWKSRVPPYYSYICTCEIREQQYRTAINRKRSLNP